MKNGNGNGKVADVEPRVEGVAVQDFYKHNSLPREAHLVMPGGPSLTRQEFAEECDINEVMRRYEGHDIGSIMRRDMEPQYADFTDVPSDLLGYMNMMQDAERAFMTLPAMVRRVFDNSAVDFVTFASDPNNLGQLREWGLAPPAKPQVPVDLSRDGIEAQEKKPPGEPPAGVKAPAGGGATHGST